eukprot:4163965-Pleurochrysis_carterae.AAC.1
MQSAQTRAVRQSSAEIARVDLVEERDRGKGGGGVLWWGSLQYGGRHTRLHAVFAMRFTQSRWPVSS